MLSCLIPLTSSASFFLIALYCLMCLVQMRRKIYSCTMPSISPIEGDIELDHCDSPGLKDCLIIAMIC